jgi:hypothetical protein
MQGIMKQAKLKAIMDIISQMDDMELERLMPKEKEMMPMESGMKEIKPEKKGITIMKIQSSKSPEIEMEDENEDDSGENDSEEIDPMSSLARLKARLKKGM